MGKNRCLTKNHQSRHIYEGLCYDRERLTGFPEGRVVAAAVEGISFPLEREEAVDT
jgi:hypothetical protein